jgi:hypothetical protein
MKELERKCRDCGLIKSIAEYYRTTYKKKECYHTNCKSCYIKRNQERYDPIKQRDNNLKRLYGKQFGIDEYNKLLEKQDFKCAICKTTEIKGRKTGRGGQIEVFYVDHDHKTGKVRGLLCNICNRTMGYVGENSGVLEEMIKYLQKHQPTP